MLIVAFLFEAVPFGFPIPLIQRLQLVILARSRVTHRFDIKFNCEPVSHNALHGYIFRPICTLTSAVANSTAVLLGSHLSPFSGDCSVMRLNFP